MSPTVREARLRADFAHLYPGVTPEEWRPAAELATQVLARIIILADPEPALHARVLDDRHFDFRGHASARGERRPLRERLAEVGYDGWIPPGLDRSE